MQKKSMILALSGVLTLSLGLGGCANPDSGGAPEAASETPAASGGQAKEEANKPAAPAQPAESAEPTEGAAGKTESLREEKIEVGHAVFLTADDAEEQSDAVVRVTATADRETVVEEDAGETIGSTITRAKVSKIYKDSDKQAIGGEIAVMEPYYAAKDDNNDPVQYYYEEYVPMREGKEYILFLVWDETHQAYWVNALEQGEHPLDSSEIRAASGQAGDGDEQYLALRKSVLEKYMN
ncbi:hypothetical protein [Saccharibacillus alkalitolerans]|uniref:Lipoprotein n=1 Tax=Saccharibacillus alkalitolerans TaxID=2705290 RepID=A0ABX0F8I6_9BACL|nr:hypothetical protein [Saccharibacillus alkalitolerans]NGZ77266.1 hypothetical protein [Saccharibacillus alkalitolerans]